MIVNREQFSSVRLGLEIAYALGKLYPGKIDLESCRRLIGNRKVIERDKIRRRSAGDRATNRGRFEHIRRSAPAVSALLDRKNAVKQLIVVPNLNSWNFKNIAIIPLDTATRPWVTIA